MRPHFIFQDKEIVFLRQTFLTQDVKKIVKLYNGIFKPVFFFLDDEMVFGQKILYSQR